MKYYSILLILIIAISCNKEFNDRERLLGNWEMTEYKKDGVVIEGEDSFINTSINIFKGYSQLFATRNTHPCNETIPMGISYSEDEISFSKAVSCDTLNKIDPYFYQTQDSTRNGNYYSGTWNFEYRDKRMFVITNENQTRESTIRIVFEKIK